MRRKRAFAGWILAVIFIYVALFPSFSPELAVRKSLLFKHPLFALTGEVTKGKINNDPRYGDLYYAEKADMPFVYVKKSWLGWYVSSSGSGP